MKLSGHEAIAVGDQVEGKRTMNLKRTMRKTLERLNIPYAEERTGWRGSDRYGWSPVISLVIDGDDNIARFRAERSATEKKRAAARQRRTNASHRREAELCALADSMGLLRDSRTFAAYLRGDIDEAEARRIGRVTAHRHEETDYESLLTRGCSKEDARALMVTYE